MHLLSRLHRDRHLCQNCLTQAALESKERKLRQSVITGVNNPDVFSAIVLIETLDQFNKLEDRKYPGEQLNKRQAIKEFNSLKNAPLKTRFIELAACPIKNDDDFIKAANRFREEFLAMNLWTAFIKARSAGLTPEQIDKVHSDRIAKARLIFSWLAYSIDYYNDLAKEKARVSGYRPYGNVLFTEKEVCRGYADMFCVIFNALLPEGETLEAKKVSGYVRYGGAVPMPEAAKATCGHAWTAFPTDEGNEFKLINAT
ncbi:hypothetical protein ABW20_dc0103304 [Dactylellina cionopaga]|nr:hypothetical protein ABW20_dc0103304 [Dactylellina cionopaga]